MKSDIFFVFSFFQNFLDVLKMNVRMTSCSKIVEHLDEILQIIDELVEKPAENWIRSRFRFCSSISLFLNRIGALDSLANLTTNLVQSYFLTISFYFVFLLISQMLMTSMEREIFLDPFIATRSHCVQIDFLERQNSHRILSETRLMKNFLQDNSVIPTEQFPHDQFNQTRIENVLSLIDGQTYVTCHRSLFLYARYEVYRSLLNGESSFYRLRLSRFDRTFFFDRPPFIDLCLNVWNSEQLEQLIQTLLPYATFFYSSINLFIFDLEFTQISLTLYKFDRNSTHLERTSTRTGWFFDLYQQISSIKYQGALSTVHFDGAPLQEHYVHYFDSIRIPLPADPILALNEMSERDLIILKNC